MTADQQKENASDRKITQTIRRALIQDKPLASYANNVTIVAHGGQVTLQGPVRTEDEQRTFETNAAEMAGGWARAQPDERRAGQRHEAIALIHRQCKGMEV